MLSQFIRIGGFGLEMLHHQPGYAEGTETDKRLNVGGAYNQPPPLICRSNGVPEKVLQRVYNRLSDKIPLLGGKQPLKQRKVLCTAGYQNLLHQPRGSEAGSGDAAVVDKIFYCDSIYTFLLRK